ncbi:MAG: hypothetical protein M1820_009556 [Bogoriella megaspora]|nr:MAG: hypothetical protein M1820_009556 [Bogoriella megaspora]
MDTTSSFEEELALLQAMYPEELNYEPHSRELSFTTTGNAVLILRIQDSYPSTDSFPDIISATGPPPTKHDLRNQFRTALQDAQLNPQEPVLDTIINIFNDLCTNASIEMTNNALSSNTNHLTDNEDAKPLTVIIWLHHLLNTSKRQLALNPPAPVSGISKPGHPGVLVFSGPSSLVSQHVRELKALRWQAFSVRAEIAELWEFSHGEGVREVGSMGEVVAGVVGEGRRDVVLDVLKIT